MSKYIYLSKAIAGLVFLWCSPSIAVSAPPRFYFSTLAGSPNSSGAADGSPSSARFYTPTGVASDAHGNIYVADYTNHAIRKLTKKHDGTYITSTIAGLAGSYGYADGTGSSARFNSPTSIAIDSVGNLFVVERAPNRRIRKITPAGVVTTFAGRALVWPYYSEGATGTNAFFMDPWGIAIDASDNIYVSDMSYCAIRKITPAGVVTTFAGPVDSAQTGTTDGTGTAARFSQQIRGLSIDRSGNLWVADGFSSTIRKVTPAGVVSTAAGQANATGFVDGTGSSARFYMPWGVRADGSYIYVADTYNNAIRYMTNTGVVSKAGGQGGFWGNGHSDNIGIWAMFEFPSDVCVGLDGGMYVADTENHVIRSGSPSIGIRGLPSTIATYTSTPSKVFAAAVADSHGLYSIQSITLDYAWNGGSWTQGASDSNPTTTFDAIGHAITLGQSGTLSVRATVVDSSGTFTTSKDVDVTSTSTPQPTFLIANPGSYNYGPSYMHDSIANAYKVWWTGSPPTGGDAIYYKDFSNTNDPAIVFSSNTFGGGLISDVSVIRLDSAAPLNEKFTLTSGNFPHSADFGDYTYAMYYVEADHNASIEYNQIAVAFSNDGITWTQGKHVVSTQDSTPDSGSYGAGYPSVSVIGTGSNRVFCMFNIEYSGDALGRNHGSELYFRKSSDGITWPERSTDTSVVTMVSMDGIYNQHVGLHKLKAVYYVDPSGGRWWYVSFDNENGEIYVHRIAADPTTHIPTGSWSSTPIHTVTKPKPLYHKNGDGLLKTERGHLPAGLIWPVYSGNPARESLHSLIPSQLYYDPSN